MLNIQIYSQNESYRSFCGNSVHTISYGNFRVCFVLQFIEGGTMISPTVLARRCLCYLMSNRLQEALADAMQAQVTSPEWPTAFYLQAAALFSLGMDSDARETLKDGSTVEARR